MGGRGGLASLFEKPLHVAGGWNLELPRQFPFPEVGKGKGATEWLLEEKAHSTKPGKSRKNADSYGSDQAWLACLINLLFLLWQPNSETKLRHNQVTSHQVRAAAQDR